MTDDQLLRYSRHLLLEEIDAAYADALREAVACGVEVLAYGVRLNHEEMVIDRRLDVLLNG